MNIRKLLKLFFGALPLLTSFSFSLEKEEKFDATTAIYKTIGDVKLSVKIYSPKGHTKDMKSPAIVFFFGGGWKGGNMNHFKRQAEYFAGKGYVCITPEYRTKNKNNTTPFESLKDARSAMRWVRAHAADYGIDPDKIIAGGGSAGGHLAAACAYTTKINEDSDDLSVSPRPSALLLFNPVIDNGPASGWSGKIGYGYDRVGDRYVDFSPIYNISKPALPTIFMLGTADTLIPVSTAEKFRDLTIENGGTCELLLYEGQPHGFFNSGKPEGAKYYEKTLHDAEAFLQKLDLFKK